MDQSDKGYVIDANSAAELARLLDAERNTTWCMGGLFPERQDLADITSVLDVACGPGGWALEVAFQHPQIEVVGIDISPRMIEYAQEQVQSQGLENIHFRVMDATKALDFSTHAFDLVNMRFASGFMLPALWPQFIRECVRITRPGGVIRLTESEGFGITTSPALERLNALSAEAGYKTGRNYHVLGRTIGITPMLRRFLQDGGCHTIQTKAHVMDFSADTPTHRLHTQNLLVILQLMKPFLLASTDITAETFDDLCYQAEMEMLAPDFSAVLYFLTAWARTPEATPVV